MQETFSSFGWPKLRESLLTNTFKAHSEFIQSGLNGEKGDAWSEAGYMINHLKGSLNDTDVIMGLLAESPQASFWYLLYELAFFSGVTMKTIDGGKLSFLLSQSDTGKALPSTLPTAVSC